MEAQTEVWTEAVETVVARMEMVLVVATKVAVQVEATLVVLMETAVKAKEAVVSEAAALTVVAMVTSYPRACGCFMGGAQARCEFEAGRLLMQRQKYGE